MKNRAKTYHQFIKEAYIDDSGELQDIEFPGKGDYDFEMLDQAQRIQEYLEESGADHVRLRVKESVFEFKFEYRGSHYLLELDLDENRAYLSIGRILVYEDTADSFFDLLASTGLEFLNY
jgi:hypothetical protein